MARLCFNNNNNNNNSNNGSFELQILFKLFLLLDIDKIIFNLLYMSAFVYTKFVLNDSFV